MKNTVFLLLFAAMCAMVNACGKESNCEKSNTGMIIIYNNLANSSLYLTIDRSFGPGLSGSDVVLSAGESTEIDLPSGLHELYGLLRTPIGNNGVSQSSVEDKEVVLDACEEFNVYYRL